MSAVKDVLALWLLRFVIFLTRVLPERLAMGICRGIIFGLRVFMHRIDAVAMRNCELVFPEMSTDERQRIIDGHYESLARNIYYFANIPTLTKEKAEQMFDFSAVASEYNRLRGQSPDVGVLVATMHLGVFELCIQAIALCIHPIAILARGFGMKRVDTWWNKQRATYGIEVFARRGGYQEILNRLKAGQDVALLADQNVKANHAVFVDLCGLEAATTKTVAIAHIRTGAPVLFSVSASRGDGTHEIMFEPLTDNIPENLNTDEKIQLISQRMNLAMEKVIRKYPEQWFWIHRRFKTRPFGEPETLYSDS